MNSQLRTKKKKMMYLRVLRWNYWKHIIYKTSKVKIYHQWVVDEYNLSTRVHEDNSMGMVDLVLRAVLNIFRKQYPTKQQLYGHLPTISQTIQVKWTKHVGHCWKSKAMFSHGLVHMDAPVLADQQRFISVLWRRRIQSRRPARSDGCKGLRERKRERERRRRRECQWDLIGVWVKVNIFKLPI